MKDQIKKSLSRKSSEELRTIYGRHDLDQWSEEVFEIIPTPQGLPQKVPSSFREFSNPEIKSLSSLTIPGSESERS